MLEQLSAFLTSNELFSSLTNSFATLNISFENFFENATSLRVVSIVILLAALILLLLLVVVLYVKSIMSFMKKDSSSSKASPKKLIVEDTSYEKDLEKELEKELEKDLEREVEQQEIQKHQVETLNKEIAKEIAKETEKKQKKGEKIKLDWQKGQVSEEVATTAPEPQNLSYVQSPKPLSDLLGLAADMLSRGVDEFKVAQTLMSRSQSGVSEDDVLQLIDALKSFATLCAKGEFKEVSATLGIDEATAMNSFISGDVSQSLLLIEVLMDAKIEQGAKMPQGDKREMVFSETSNLANLFGTIASLNDDSLALGAFELSIELDPQNINSWSKIGNIYTKLQSHNKAVWAYQNVVNAGDETQNPAEFANACNMLSKHLYASGDSVQATKLYDSSKSFYDLIGINRHLDKQEEEIVTLIENNQKQNTSSVVSGLLNSYSNQRIA